MDADDPINDYEGTDQIRLAESAKQAAYPPALTKSQRNKRKRLFRLSLPMLHQLYAYAEEAGREGWFYGNEAQFRKRHQRIMKWLDAIRARRIEE